MTDKPTVTLVVFDCDGTLVDSQHNVVASMNDAFEARGMPAPDEHSIRNCIGLNIDEAVLQYLPDPADTTLLDALVDAYKAAYFRRRQLPDHDEPLYRGTLETIRILHQRGVKMAVATGKSMRGLNAVIDHHGLEGFFISLQTPDHNPGKPHPQMLEKAMLDAGADPARTFMVGDTSYDMMLARNAGCIAVGVSWGYHDGRELQDSGADYLIDDFEELINIVLPQ
ncbi:MAG: HAD-IA family hydrolase [Sneathiella sp.]